MQKIIKVYASLLFVFVVNGTMCVGCAFGYRTINGIFSGCLGVVGGIQCTVTDGKGNEHYLTYCWAACADGQNMKKETLESIDEKAWQNKSVKMDVEFDKDGNIENVHSISLSNNSSLQKAGKLGLSGTIYEHLECEYSGKKSYVGKINLTADVKCPEINVDDHSICIAADTTTLLSLLNYQGKVLSFENVDTYWVTENDANGGYQDMLIVDLRGGLDNVKQIQK